MSYWISFIDTLMIRGIEPPPKGPYEPTSIIRNKHRVYQCCNYQLYTSMSGVWMIGKPEHAYMGECGGICSHAHDGKFGPADVRWECLRVKLKEPNKITAIPPPPPPATAIAAVPSHSKEIISEESRSSIASGLLSPIQSSASAEDLNVFDVARNIANILSF